jgi:two-component system, LytTR family, response regulator
MMRSLVIDDEPSARARIIRLLAAHSSIVKVIGEARDGLEAVEQITSLRPDLIFLDVEMPGLNGFQVLQSLPEEELMLPLVIFITGYDQHALAAFEADAVAYLMKPVETERLAQVLDRAYRIYSFEPQRATEQQTLSSLIKNTPTPLRQAVGRKRDRFFLLSPDEIIFFRADDGIVRAHTATEVYWVNYQLNYLEACLPEEIFFRAHRSAIVNLTKIKEMRPFSKSSFLLLMSDQAQTEIKVSERQAALLRRRFPGL